MKVTLRNFAFSIFHFAFVLALSFSASAEPYQFCWDTQQKRGMDRGGTWKVIAGSTEGVEQTALKVLTERLSPLILREQWRSSCMVLPIEYPGSPKVMNKRNAIVIGVPGKNPALDVLIKREEVPAGGYLVKTLHKDGHNFMVVAGAGPQEVLWGVFDLLDYCLPEIEMRHRGGIGRYEGDLFRDGVVPAMTRATAPETKYRTAWSWGNVVDDLDATFGALAAQRFNRVILWNDQPVINAKEVVEKAHAWGLEIFWGFSWGWTLSDKKNDQVDFDGLAKGIIDEWHRIWKHMGGDGYYFQSFTETPRKMIAGRLIAEAAVEVINKVAAAIHAEEPTKKITWGLHASSIHDQVAMNAVAKVDPSLSILWEDCGPFPYTEGWARPRTPNFEYSEKAVMLTDKVGLLWKAQMRIDWGHYVEPAGPFILGHAGPRTLAFDQKTLAPKLPYLDEDWYVNGKGAWELVRRVRALKRPPQEFSACCEYNPPYTISTQCQAELFWSAKDSWEEIMHRVRLRVKSQQNTLAR